MNNITIRMTCPDDYGTVYNLIKTAFITAEHTDGTEQDYATQLRTSDAHIPQLDLVAEIDGKIVGHIMFTRATVTRLDGSRYDSLLVAPLSVLLEYRSCGVGSALMTRGLEAAPTLGFEAAILLGDPNYYQRFGFRQATNFGITHPEFPAQYLLAVETRPQGLQNGAGVLTI